MLRMWTIYRTASDTFRAVEWLVRAPSEAQSQLQEGEAHWGSLGELRTELAARGLYRLDRDPSDDPSIVETWI